MQRGRSRKALAPASALVVASYVALLVFLAVAMVLWGWELAGPPPTQVVVVLSLLGVTGAALREREVTRYVGVSFATVVFAAAIALAGPVGAVIVGFVSYAADINRQSLRTRAFNAGMSGCLGGIGALVYLLAGGVAPVPTATEPVDLLLRLTMPLVLGYLVMTLANAVLLAIMIRLANGGSLVLGVMQTLRQVHVGYLMHVLLGLLLVILWQPAGVGSFSAVLILGPLLLAQWTISRDADERRAHARTVSTLMGALELANPYSVGHSGRVATLCDRMAPRLGLSRDDAETVHYAALLHDLGLVATAPRLPRGSGSVDITYLAALTEHPEAGVRMLQDIDFLAPALPGILHHHERMDGRGYPAGIGHGDIPLFARMIAVADAFDSLTTTRSYRPALTPREGLDALRARVGSHLDPVVVQALEEALEREPWSETVIEDHVLASTGDVYDHDDPEVCDQYASWQPDAEDARR